MRTTRIAVLTLASLAACASARAQQPETCAKQAEECAKKAEVCAREAEECAKKAQEEAQVHAVRSRRHHEAARAYAQQDHAEKIKIEAEVAAAHEHAREALARVNEKLREEQGCQAERARQDAACQSERIREALEAAAVVHDIDAEALQEQIEAALATQDDFRVHIEALAQERQGMNDAESLLAQHLGALARAQVQGQGSSQGLEERIRALEERLGVSDEDDERSLEERVAELERRTMAGEERRIRKPGKSDAERDMAEDHETRLYELSRPRAFTMRRAPSLAVPGQPAPMGGVARRGRLGVAAVPPTPPTPPAETPRFDVDFEVTTPVPFDEAVPPPGEAPEASELPEMRVFTRTTPSAPRRVRTLSTSGLTAERRKEVEEVMERMRTQMEHLREEMSRLRTEMGRAGNLRGLGYVDDEDDDSEDE